MDIEQPSDFDGKLVPTAPGAYLFMEASGTIIYCGKAKNLRKRVRSYFSRTDRLSVKTRQLVSKTRKIDWIVVGNEVEALLLENNLIKEHSPKYNISLKDAKTFGYIAMTREKFPRILTSRKTGPNLDSFGPYTDGSMRRELQKLVVSVFKLRTCRSLPTKACLNYRIGICTAPCIGNVSESEYAKQVDDARLFLKGDFEKTKAALTEQMREASGERKYEIALEIRNQLSSIELLSKKQVVDSEKDYDQDIIVFRRVGERMMVVQMGIRGGVLLGKKDFDLEMQDEFEREFIRAFYSTNQMPREIILGKAFWSDEEERKALEAYLAKTRGAPVNLVVPDSGERLSLVEIAGKNIDANMEEDGALADIQDKLNLPALPSVIESFDVSNIGDQHIVSGMVRFVNAKSDKNGYRRFRIRTVPSANDLASIREAVYRRYSRLIDEKSKMPDLVLIDGGMEQLKSARISLQSLGLQLPVISLAKKLEEVYLPGEAAPRRFDNNSKMMLLLRRIRDETHRFSIAYNKKRRQMKMKEEFSK